MGKLLLGVLLFTSATAPSLFAQAAASSGEVTRRVTDPSGAAVSGAAVQSTNTGTGFRQSVKTGEAGLYRIPLLPLGSYEVEVQAPGFGAAKRTGVVINAGATATVDIALALASSSTVVEVQGAGALADPDRTDLGITLASNMVRNLPLVSRNPYNFILFQPNVSGRANTEFGVPRKINANGFNARINYQIDGSNNTESDRAGIRLIPISDVYVEQIQQVSNGFAPEFGNTVGTVFNTITKSGTNEFHGEGSYLFRRTGFSARPKLLAAAALTPEVNVDSYAADGGGRAIRDKLFFFGGFEHVKRDLPAPVTVTPANLALLGLPAEYGNAIPFGQSVYFYMAKADWLISPAHRLTARYMHHRNDSPYNNGTIGGLNLITRSYNFVDRSHVGAVQLVSMISPSAVNELRGQVAYRGQQNQAFSGSGTGPAIVISGVANFGGPTDVGFVYQETTPEIVDNLTYIRGSHSFKAGFSLRAIRDTQIAASAATYTFATVADYLGARNGATPRSYSNFAQGLGNFSLDYNSLFSGFFAQDTWKPRRNLSLTYGIRYDVYKMPEANAASPFAYSRAFRTDKNNFAPRLGAAWSLGSDQKTVVRASTGFFYDAPQTDQYRQALLRNGTPQFFNVTAGPASQFAPNFPGVFTSVPTGFNLPPQDIYTVDPNFATLYSFNANLAISRELGGGFVGTAGYLFTSGTHLPVYRNLNLVPAGRLLDDGRPVFGSARVYPGLANILSAESVGKSNYNGLNLMLQRRGRMYDLIAAYAWSHAIDDAPEQNNIDSSNFLLSDPTNRSRDRADSLTDKRHSFNMTGVFTPEVKFSNAVANYLANHNRLSVGVVAASGDLFNIGSNAFLNGDTSLGTAFQRPLFVGRNTVRAPSVFELNARYSRLFPVSERKSLEFLAESTNLTNTLNVTGLNTTALVDSAGNVTRPSPNAATAARDQRLLQLGVRFNF
jgi:hypothetical protein